MPRYKWQPLRQGYMPLPSEALIAEWMKSSPGMTRDQVIAKQDSYDGQCTVWLNDTYQVQRRVVNDGKSVHLNIRRRDGGPILRDWRHFQWIKNQLIGEECEAIEIYPAESRLVDTSNKYHLFGWLDPTYRVPVNMFETRDVSYETGRTPGTRQRPL